MLSDHPNIYIDTAMDERPSQIGTNLKTGQWILNTFLLTDYQTFSGQTKYDLRSATQLLHNTLQKHDLEKSIKMYTLWSSKEHTTYDTKL